MRQFPRHNTNRVETLGEAALRLLAGMDAKQGKATGRLYGPVKIHRDSAKPLALGRQAVWFGVGLPPHKLTPGNDNRRS